jgi:hypothetical protein
MAEHKAAFMGHSRVPKRVEIVTAKRSEAKGAGFAACHSALLI